MYCQTSSSVQLLIGTRARARRDARARCTGSTARPLLRGPTGRIRRAPRTRAPWRAPFPRRAARRRSRVEAELGDRLEQRHRLAALRLSSFERSLTLPRRIDSSTERTIRRSPSSAARRSRNSITSGKCARCRWQQREGKRPGRNAFSARRSRQIESLPPERTAPVLHWPRPRAG